MSRSPQPKADTERVSELFSEALDISPEQRRAFLAAAAIDAPLEAAEASSLLAAHAGSGPLDSELDAAKAEKLIQAQARGPLPVQIGPYRIVRELGRGGMGVVYLAERAEGGFEQRVALKLVKRGMDSEAILARFLHERQILARLDHPGIARLLDGGLTSDGQPYFAMEYVEAEPITRYCKRVGLGLEGRLDLFATICRAVQYAHGQLVVHRDLKPSNVLVTADGVVKLVDFGIAKLLDPDTGAVAAAGLTSHGARALTPEYASPEQIRGEVVTVTSDVFALGLLLYELLVGRSPYATPLTTPEEVRRAVCETDPLPPSLAVLRGESQEVQTSRFARRLRGDLDNVILKALAKDTARRYQSVEALAEDLQRFRSGRPVRAHRAGWTYRARKYVGRNRVELGAMLALVLGLTGTAWQATTAARERDRAQLEAQKLVVTQEYLVGLFQAADPARALGEEVTAKDLVTRGIERLDAELGEQPEVQLEMLEALGRVSLALGEYEQAEMLLERALELARKLSGKHSAEADLLFLLGRLRNSRGAWATAETALRESLSLMERHDIENPSIEVATLSSLAESLKNQGDLERAIPLGRRALETARRHFGHDSREVADLLNNLGNALKASGDYSAAEASLQEALAIKRELLGVEHLDIATELVNLAGVLFRKGDWLEAEVLYREGVAMERRMRGDGHPRLAIKLHNLANLLNALGEFEEAATLHREVLASVRENMGEQSPYYATTIDSLASDLAEGGHFSEAMPLFEQAQVLLAESVGTEHEFFSFNLWRHASALRLQGLNREAMPLVEEAIRVAEGSEKTGPFASMLIERGAIQHALGAVEEAEQDFRDALRMQRESLPPDHPNVVRSQTSLGWVLLTQERRSEAVEILQDAVELAETVLPGGHWRHAEARAALGAALIELGFRSEGEPMLLTAHAQLSASRGAEHPASRRAAQFLD
ncbi:MAG: serine/threonine-protein kinase [Thermoanaerobaculia bacterium]|nr:serine/threonine-protein kinase [Thermoanaerobaculia bacterium]